MSASTRTIVIYGNSFAAHLTAAACATSLGQDTRIVHIAPEGDAESDLMYGSATAPNAYDFFRMVGLDEPTLVARTSASFSYGTQFRNWPGRNSAWIQTFHLPLPNPAGIPLQHFLTQRSEPLESYLVSAQAALSGAFAHPPADPKLPLSRAEYGYNISVRELSRLVAEFNTRRSIERVSEGVTEIEVREGRIESLRLESNRSLQADLFVDCSGEERRLIHATGGAFRPNRTLEAHQLVEESSEIGAPCRSLEAQPNGWKSATPLRGRREVLILHSPNGAAKTSVASSTIATATVQAGALDDAWLGNCVAVGHAAWMLEPITPAPMMLLQRDIERLLDLIPVTANCSVERREYNRRFSEDLEHASAFQQTLFCVDDVPQFPYWQDAAAQPVPDRLRRKLAQFESRGLLVRYDLEPFNAEDWTILLNGMGLKPKRYDRQVDAVDQTAIEQQLAGLKAAVSQMVSKMPPHHVYLTNLKRYLEKQKHG